MRVFAIPVLVLALCLSAPPAARADGADLARGVAARVAGELVAGGYSDVTVGWTWLGRLRVTGRIDGRSREIILHPTSGEVLRDFLSAPETQMAMPDESDDPVVAATTTVTDLAKGAGRPGTVAPPLAMTAPVLGGVDAAAAAADMGGP